MKECFPPGDGVKQAGVVKRQRFIHYFSVSENPCLHTWISSFQIGNLTVCQFNPAD